MAVPRKGWRKISVEGRVYHWRATGQDWGIEVVVVTKDAFRPGDRAQQLAFTLDYDHLQTPREAGGFDLKQRAAVAPEVIRLAIERALSAKPPFTGIAGAADVTLSPQTVAEVQARARMDS
jgi:hypothetical protein